MAMSGEAFEVYSVGALPVFMVAKMLAEEFDDVTEDGGDGGPTIADALREAGFSTWAERHLALVAELRVMSAVYKELCYWRAGDQGIESTKQALREMLEGGR
jgi:hypothetical protein